MRLSLQTYIVYYKDSILVYIHFTPFRISDAQRRPPVSLKSAHEVGSRRENENWCNIYYEVKRRFLG